MHHVFQLGGVDPPGNGIVMRGKSDPFVAHKGVGVGIVAGVGVGISTDVSYLGDYSWLTEAACECHGGSLRNRPTLVKAVRRERIMAYPGWMNLPNMETWAEFYAGVSRDRL